MGKVLMKYVVMAQFCVDLFSWGIHRRRNQMMFEHA